MLWSLRIRQKTPRLNHGLDLIEACERLLKQCSVCTDDGWEWCCVCNNNASKVGVVHQPGCTVPALRAKLAKTKGNHR